MKARKPIIPPDERKMLLGIINAMYGDHPQPERKPPGNAGPAKTARPLLMPRTA